MGVYLGNTEIGQMYLGGTEIAQAYLGSTKVWEAGSPPAPQPAYITDGLVFHLDGINKGTNESGKWVDLINGVTFIADSGVVAETDGFLVGRNPEACFRNASYTAGSNTQDTYTVEAVFRIDNNINQQIFFPVSGICIGYSTSGFWVRSVVASKSQWSKSKTSGNICLSLNKSRCYENGVSRSSGATSYYGAPSETKVGRIDGKIYAVRIYNRLLSEAEILNNQSVDNTRFNLGLTITT